ncbi:hypothetical protein [Yeosuana marina]|uniref:hypothetical protein n=1 Tax=Yeosuana marina TaxID=1565536 RepID=UPI001424A591|nr:hypothetical protein [Yeosuana marina]
MKSTLNSLLLLVILLTTFACSNSDSPIGKWEDNIKLSKKTVQFSADSNSVIITTKGEWWWINNVSLDGSTTFDFGDIDTTKSNFVIEDTEFKIERKNTTEIHIEMTKNQTDAERVLRIGLEAGDYFDGITITQAAN